MKTPGRDHPIRIAPAEGRVRVIFAGEVIADTSRALELREADYAPVYYVPEDDVAMSRLVPSAHTSHCPYKGDATYYTIQVGDRRSENAVWVYESAYPPVSRIQGHLAFYPSRVDALEIDVRTR